MSPTSKISSVRTHFWAFASRAPAGCFFSPIRYGTSGCIPAVMNSTVLSSGISDAEGIIVCPFVLKKSRNFLRVSFIVIFAHSIRKINRKKDGPPDYPESRIRNSYLYGDVISGNTLHVTFLFLSEKIEREIFHRLFECTTLSGAILALAI